jgi:8-oxo-dGTP pyrophosphatase MutT (NUDIX family)
MNVAKLSKIFPWERLSQKSIYTHKFCAIYEREFQHPIDNRKGNFLVIDICDSVQIIAETAANEIILVEQFRFGCGELSLEMPAGRLDEGENVIAGAERELLEETGYAGQNAKIIAELRPNPAFQMNKTYAVHIGECEKISQTNFDELEELATIIVTKNELINLVKCDKIKNSLTLSAIAKFML